MKHALSIFGILINQRYRNLISKVKIHASLFILSNLYNNHQRDPNINTMIYNIFDDYNDIFTLYMKSINSFQNEINLYLCLLYSM